MHSGGKMSTTGFRTVRRGGRTYRIPIREPSPQPSQGNSRYIQKAIKHPGRVKEYIRRTYGDEAFTERGTIRPEYLEKARAKAEETGNRSMVEAIDLAIRMRTYRKGKQASTRKSKPSRKESAA